MSLTRITSAGHAEPHRDGMATRVNWLRAAVLGANDGIVSMAGLVVGVAGATASRTPILTEKAMLALDRHAARDGLRLEIDGGPFRPGTGSDVRSKIPAS